MADVGMVCEVCGTEIEVPLCCNEPMAYKDGVMVCSLCGADEEVQICCGKKMKVVVSQ